MTTVTRHCLICGSRVLISQEEAGGVVVVLGVFAGLARGIRQTARTQSRETSSAKSEAGLPELEVCLAGVNEVSASKDSVASFRDDVIRHHFVGQQYLCLRCGARQNRTY